MSINKTINQTKIYDGEDTVEVVGADKNELNIRNQYLENILESILDQIKKINVQLSLITGEEIEV